MAVLREIVKTVLVIIIIASFLELLLPDGKIKPFVRLSIGLFILIAVLNPVLSFLFSHQDFEVNFWDYKIDRAAQEQILEKGKSINQQLIHTTDQAVKEKLQGQISAIAMLVPGVEDVQTRVDVNDDGAVRKLRLVVRPGQIKHDETQPAGNLGVFSGNKEGFNEEEQAEIGSKITNILNNFYDFSGVDIEIQFEGG